MTTYPEGLRVGLALNETNDPLISLYMVLDAETAAQEEYVFTEQEVEAMIAMLYDGLTKAKVLREMLTMFPDQTDQIVANILFRWSGQINGS